MKQVKRQLKKPEGFSQECPMQKVNQKKTKKRTNSIQNLLLMNTKLQGFSNHIVSAGIPYDIKNSL